MEGAPKNLLKPPCGISHELLGAKKRQESRAARLPSPDLLDCTLDALSHISLVNPPARRESVVEESDENLGQGLLFGEVARLENTNLQEVSPTYRSAPPGRNRGEHHADDT